MQISELVKTVKNENLYHNLSWLLVEESKKTLNTNLVEGFQQMMTTMFTSSKKPAVTKPKINIDDFEEKKPFAGLCKSGKTILIPDTPLFRTNETELINKVSILFRGDWVNDPEANKCINYVISFLLRKYLDDIDNDTDINLDIIGDALVNGHLNYATSNKDYIIVKRVYDRISSHRDKLIDSLFNTPSSFKTSFSDLKKTFPETIKNILKTGGDITLSMGQDKAKNDDSKKALERQQQKTKKS